SFNTGRRLKGRGEKDQGPGKRGEKERQSISRDCCTFSIAKKSTSDLGGPRGRLISTPNRANAIKLIDEARASGARLESACTELGISGRTYQRWSNGNCVKEDQRPIIKRPPPKNKLKDEERSHVIDIANSPKYADLPPCKIVPKLADEGIYVASESTFYRILKEENMNAHRNRTKKPLKREMPTHVAYGPNQVWTWDITWLNASIKGQYFKLYLVVDMFSRYIVSYEVWEAENAEYAEQLVRKAVLSQGLQGRPLVLHSDNGSPMKAATFQATLEKLGIQSSFSRPRVSNDNPYSESLFKTMKYRPKYPTKGFKTLSEARAWVQKFVWWYNFEHLHSGLKFITPHQRHYGLDKKIIKNRIKVYKRAREKHPERWSRNIRDWELPKYVALNPISEIEVKKLLNKSS
ncbi:MAG: IS3 family transposase, partial [Clostridiales bacterium]|nr:IS3 family transposase [Clostridiales bacterium]